MLLFEHGLYVFMQKKKIACTLTFGNHAYLHINVSLIQMLKAFTPVMVMLLLFITKQEMISLPLIGSICLLCIGTALTCNGISFNDNNNNGNPQNIQNMSGISCVINV